MQIPKRLRRRHAEYYVDPSYLSIWYQTINLGVCFRDLAAPDWPGPSTTGPIFQMPSAISGGTVRAKEAPVSANSAATKKRWCTVITPCGRESRNQPCCRCASNAQKPM